MGLWFPYFESVKWFLIVQFIFIGLHLIAALFLTPILSFFYKRKQVKLEILKQILFTHSGQELPKLPFRTISFLIPAIIAIDEEKRDPHWKKLRQSLFETFLFPQAQKFASSRKWAKRVQAVGCFSLFPDPKNESYVLHLLKDPIPMVQYGAAFCAAKLGTASCVNAIIDAMNRSDRFLRHPFREAFLRGDPSSFKHIEERLEKDKDPLTHVSCLEVLSEHMNAHVADLARQDLQASHKNLRIAAIRALGHYSEPKTIAALIDLLKDSEWEVRAIAARSLGYLHALEALFELSHLLKDKVWWVRMNSALALKRLGEKGKKILEDQDPKKDRYAYEIAQYILPMSLDG